MRRNWDGQWWSCMKTLLTKNCELEIWFFISFWKELWKKFSVLKDTKPGRNVKRKGQQATSKVLKEIVEHSPELCQAAGGGPGKEAEDDKWS